MDDVLRHLNYWAFVVMVLIGLYAAIAKTNLVKKIMGLSLFQTGIFVFYISMGVVQGSTAPVVWPKQRLEQAAHDLDALDGPESAHRVAAVAHLEHHDLHSAWSEVRQIEDPEARRAAANLLPRPYANPLPHVLILTAIVVSVSTMAVALALAASIKRAFGTVESPELLELEYADAVEHRDTEGGAA